MDEIIKFCFTKVKIPNISSITSNQRGDKLVLLRERIETCGSASFSFIVQWRKANIHEPNSPVAPVIKNELSWTLFASSLNAGYSAKYSSAYEANNSRLNLSIILNTSEMRLDSQSNLEDKSQTIANNHAKA